MFWKQHLTTLCGYQSYSSCWNSLASEWGWRGGADVDGNQICSSHLSFRCVHPNGPPGPSSLALLTGCVYLMLCRASSKTSHTAESRPICYFYLSLPEDLPYTYTDTYVRVKTALGGNAAEIQRPLWFNRACYICSCVQITKKNEQSQHCEVKLLYFIVLITWNEPPYRITIVVFRRACKLGIE